MNRRIPFTGPQILAHVCAVVILLGLGLYLLLVWFQIPEQIPGHYNFAGQPDRWEGKGSLLFLYLTNAGLYLVILGVSFFPKAWNIPVKITPNNEARVYSYCLGMLTTTALTVVILLGYITLISSLARPLGGWFLLVFFLLIFGSIGYYMVKMFRCQ